MIYDVETRDAILVWNPRVGYHCSACSWTRQVHVQDRLPDEDAWTQKVRREFADHVREKHSQTEANE